MSDQYGRERRPAEPAHTEREVVVSNGGGGCPGTVIAPLIVASNDSACSLSSTGLTSKRYDLGTGSWIRPSSSSVYVPSWASARVSMSEASH